MLKHTFSTALLSFSLITALSACDAPAQQQANADKHITIGFGVGTYLDQVRHGVVPTLEKQGYKVTLRQFTQGVQINPALDEGAIRCFKPQPIWSRTIRKNNPTSSPLPSTPVRLKPYALRNTTVWPRLKMA